MAHSPTPRQHLIGNRVASAKTRTEKVQQDIERAEAELHLANLVITDKLAQSVSEAELARVASHTELVGEKLHDAHQDLKVVTELLNSEERDRRKLEQPPAQHRESEGPPLAGARSGEGSASVIEHLRELTRHRLNSDPVGPADPK